VERLLGERVERGVRQFKVCAIGIALSISVSFSLYIYISLSMYLSISINLYMYEDLQPDEWFVERLLGERVERGVCQFKVCAIRIALSISVSFSLSLYIYLYLCIYLYQYIYICMKTYSPMTGLWSDCWERGWNAESASSRRVPYVSLSPYLSLSLSLYIYIYIYVSIYINQSIYV